MNERIKTPNTGVNKTVYCLIPLIVYVAVNLAISVFVAAAAMMPGSGSGFADFMKGNYGAYVVSIIFDACLIIAALPLRRRDLIRDGERREKLTGIVNIILAVIMGFAVSIILNLFVTLIGADELMEKFDPARVEMLSSGSPGIKIIALCIFAPIAEELIFRVLLFGRLRRFMRFLPAALISAVCFGIVHIEPVTGACAFIIGVLMAFLYEKTGSIFQSMFFHFGFNFYPSLIFLLSEVGGLGALETPENEAVQKYVNMGLIIWIIFGAVIFVFSFIMFLRRNNTAEMSDTAFEAAVDETEVFIDDKECRNED